MLNKIRSAAHEFRTVPPGRRFQGLHRHSGNGGAGSLLRWAAILISLALIAAGVFFMLVPGPGLLIALFGLALLAAVSRRLAVLLDRGEVLLRRLWERLRSR